jgi:DNA-binding response OmpR family regulator
MNILLVEDEKSIRKIEKLYLEKAGYTVTESEDGADAIDKFKDNTFDLVILDLNLPTVDGIQVCRRIRSKSQVPIIMVTARDTEEDEILGFDFGADDYVKKPFSPSVLVTRVNSLLKRNKNNKIISSNLVIDPEKQTLVRNKKEVDLTSTQFNILLTLAKSPGKIYSREELLRASSDKPTYKETDVRTIDAHIKNIRKLVENDPKAPQIIKTVINKGYKYNEV